MPSRFRTVLSVALALVLVWTSGLQAARAWIDGSVSESMVAHNQAAMTQASAHENLGHKGDAESAPQNQRNCLLVCLDASPHRYLAAQLSRTAAPDHSTLYPFPPSRTAHWHERRDLVSIYQAPRGPPRSLVILSSEGARTLLLLTARFRI